MAEIHSPVVLWSALSRPIHFKPQNQLHRQLINYGHKATSSLAHPTPARQLVLQILFLLCPLHRVPVLSRRPHLHLVCSVDQHQPLTPTCLQAIQAYHPATIHFPCDPFFATLHHFYCNQVNAGHTFASLAKSLPPQHTIHLFTSCCSGNVC